MKRILLFLLAAAMLCGLAACNSSNGDAIQSTTPSTTTIGNGEQSPNEVPFISWMNSGYYKNTHKYEGPDEKLTDFDVYMAKNESEVTQIAVRTKENINGVSFVFDGKLPDGVKAEIFEIKTLSIEGDRWPDGLVPLDGRTVDLRKDRTYSFLIKFTSQNDTPAQKSTVKVLMKDSEGNTACEYTVNLTVWDIVIPDAPAISMWAPLDKESLAKHYGLGDIRNTTLDEEKQAELDRIYKLYYDFLLEYGISGGDLPYDLLDPRADAYMSDPRVTVFTVAHSEFDEEKVKAIYDKIKDNSVWLEKAVYYVLDEPTTVDMLDQLKARAEAFRKIAPDIKIASAYYTNIKHSSGLDTTDFLQQYIDIVSPKLCLFDQLGGMDKYKARFETFKKNGNKMWTYVCWEPGKPYVNLYVNEQGIDHRIMYIQTYDIGADGWMYWCSNKWYDIEANVSPWSSMVTVPWLTYDIYGDGSFIYPGNEVGIDGACGSLRLECIRDGIEDIALLKIAEELLGKSKVDSQINKVSMGITMYASKESTFNSFRESLGNDVEAALKK